MMVDVDGGIFVVEPTSARACLPALLAEWRRLEGVDRLRWLLWMPILVACYAIGPTGGGS